MKDKIIASVTLVLLLFTLSYFLIVEENDFEKIIDYLYQNQLSNGEFRTWRCENETMTDCELDRSPFITAFVLDAIHGVDTEKAKDIQKKSIKFLLSNKEKNDLWRFWTPEDHKKIVPDIDDTSYISYVLGKYGYEFDNKNLILENRNQDGIFYTWFLKENESEIFPYNQNDIDYSVNTNVLLYLRQEIPQVCDYINTAILNDENSRYYPKKIAQYYLVSNASKNGIRCLDKHKNKIINYANSLMEQDISDMDEALAINILSNYYIRAEYSNGSLNKDVFFVGPGYYGSEELTYAFVIKILKQNL